MTDRKSTPLHGAAGEWDDEARRLLGEGADPNALDAKGRSPLHYAARCDLANTRLLLDAGADPDAADADGIRPMHFAAVGGGVCIPVLLEKGALVNPQDKNGHTPLHHAASAPSAEGVSSLLAHGADPRIPDLTGETSFDMKGVLGTGTTDERRPRNCWSGSHPKGDSAGHRPGRRRLDGLVERGGRTFVARRLQLLAETSLSQRLDAQAPPRAPAGAGLALRDIDRRRWAERRISKKMTMKRLMTLTLAAAVATVAIPALAQTRGTNPSSPNFVDKDGDGICDTYQAGGQHQAKGKGRGKGPGNGTGNQGVGPRDGSGYRATTCTGTCDGTGPKGQRKGKGRT